LDIHREDFRWKNPPYEYERKRKPIDLILGDTELREGLEAGVSISRITQNWIADLESFSQWRKPYLLYV
jgi:uncharacterized protein YbbC (DUF1343 family)